MCINTFRGITVNGDWVYGNLNILENERPDGIAAGYYISSSDGRFPFAYAVRPETVGQSTGLKDCNGDEIYKGHLISIFGYEPKEVVFETGCFGYHPHSNYGMIPLGTNFYLQWDENNQSKHVEIVGNIYENSELVGVSD